MTVAELIEKLKAMPPEAQVVLSEFDRNYHGYEEIRISAYIPVTVLGAPIGDLNLDARAYNVLYFALNCRTLGDVTQLSERQLIRTKSCGVFSVQQIKTELQRFGLSLREEIKPV